MKTSGDFKYYLDNESKTIEEIMHLVNTDMTVSIRGLDVLYFSPKYEINKILDKATKQLELEDKLCQRFSEIKLKNYEKENKTDKILKEAEEHQKQNGGILEGVEFPFDSISFIKKGMKSHQEMQERVIKGWDKIVLNDSKKQTEGQKHNEGIKETEGKLHYELSWEFIEEMAKRMANNKSDKYPLYNWKKPMDIEKLKDAINRHHIEVMKGDYKDGVEILGHVVSYACNSMMLWEQLNKNNK